MQSLNLQTIHAAGGLVIDESNRVLLIYKDGKWDLPKGIIESCDTSDVTAMKETSEETGLDINTLNVLSELIPTHHISKYKKINYLKKVDWFLLQCTDSTQNFRPQKEEGIIHCQWFQPWEIANVLDQSATRIQYLIKFWLKTKKLSVSNK